jgi:hypothetical protein
MLFLLFGSSASGKTLALHEAATKVAGLVGHGFDEIQVPRDADTAWHSTQMRLGFAGRSTSKNAAWICCSPARHHSARSSQRRRHQSLMDSPPASSIATIRPGSNRSEHVAQNGSSASQENYTTSSPGQSGCVITQRIRNGDRTSFESPAQTARAGTAGTGGRQTIHAGVYGSSIRPGFQLIGSSTTWSAG